MDNGLVFLDVKFYVLMPFPVQHVRDRSPMSGGRLEKNPRLWSKMTKCCQSFFYVPLEYKVVPKPKYIHMVCCDFAVLISTCLSENLLKAIFLIRNPERYN